MLNVHDYINEYNCLTSVSAAYNPMQGQIPYPYLVKGQYFDVSLNGRSNDKHHLSFLARLAARAARVGAERWADA